MERPPSYAPHSPLHRNGPSPRVLSISEIPFTAPDAVLNGGPRPKLPNKPPTSPPLESARRKVHKPTYIKMNIGTNPSSHCAITRPTAAPPTARSKTMDPCHPPWKRTAVRTAVNSLLMRGEGVSSRVARRTGTTMVSTSPSTSKAVTLLKHKDHRSSLTPSLSRGFPSKRGLDSLAVEESAVRKKYWGRRRALLLFRLPLVLRLELTVVAVELVFPTVRLSPSSILYYVRVCLCCAGSG